MIALVTLLVCSCTSRYAVEPARIDYGKADHKLPAPTSGAIYNAARGAELLADRRAHQVGDILTVVLAEQTSAQKSSDTAISKSSNTGITNPTLAGTVAKIGGSNLGFDLGSKHDFTGKSGSSQSNKLNGVIAVRVVGIQPDGQLVIQGEKWVKINSGSEYIRLKGIVREADISGENSILSTQVADARIAYSGTGAIADSNRMGWLSRFFLHPIWPF